MKLAELLDLVNLPDVIARELQQGYAAQVVWRALANVFEAVKCGHLSL